MIRILKGKVDLVLEDDIGTAETNIYEGEKGILQLHKPSSWNIYVSGNMEREMEIEFEKFLINVNENSNNDIDEVTVFRFYSTIEHLKDKHQQYLKNKNK